MSECVVEPVTIAVGYDGPITDLMCRTCEAPAPNGLCSVTGRGIDEDHPHRLTNTRLWEENR